MHSLHLRKALPLELPFIESLYEEAFPAIERKPFPLLLERQEQGTVEILIIVAREEALERPVGLAICAFGGDLVLLDYFAMDPGTRGQGMGGEALKLLQNRYGRGGKRFFLEIEPPDPAAENNSQRIRRKRFYERHGFEDAGLRVWVAGAELDGMTDHCRLSFSEYQDLYEAAFGPGTVSRLNIRLRDTEE